MRIDQRKLPTVFDRSLGRCLHCRQVLTYRNYGLAGRKGAWRIQSDSTECAGPACLGKCNHVAATVTAPATRPLYPVLHPAACG